MKQEPVPVFVWPQWGSKRCKMYDVRKNIYGKLSISYVRQVLDWGFFMEKHHQEINWDEYIPYIKQEGMYRFYNLLGLFCMKHLGFDASIFHGLYNDDLFERFCNEIMEPEFKDHENGKLLHSLNVKPRRWWHNRWKNRLCYKESAWEEFAYGLWAKVLKPSHFIQ